MAHPLYQVIAFTVIGDYMLHLRFDDGTERTVDFRPVLHGELFGPLSDLRLFNQVSLDPIARTVVWPNGADFDPETLRNWPDYVDELAARVQGRKQEPVA